MPPIDSPRPDFQHTDFTLGSAFVSHIARGFYSNCSTILLRLAAPTKIQTRKFEFFWPFSQVHGHFGSLCAYPLPPLSHYPISTLPPRSYRHLDHSPGHLISTSKFSIFPYHYPCTLPYSFARRHAYGSHTHCTNPVPYDCLFFQLTATFYPASLFFRRFFRRNSDPTLVIRITPSHLRLSLTSSLEATRLAP